MITRKRLAVRLSPSTDLRAQLLTVADLGLGGVVLEAVGELAPKELSQTGRREIRSLLRSGDLEIEAIALPMRRSIAEVEQWEDRIQRLKAALVLAYELGARVVMVAPGVPPTDEKRSSFYFSHLKQLGNLAEHVGVILACEAGLESADSLTKAIRESGHPSLAVSLDPGRLVLSGQNLVQVASDAHDLIQQVYATDPEFMGLGTGSQGRSVNWESTMDLLEEIGYRDRLTIWPDSTLDLARSVSQMGRRLNATPRFA